MKLEDQFQQTIRKTNAYLECWKRKWKKEEEERIKAERFARIESDIQFQQTIRKVNEYLECWKRKWKKEEEERTKTKIFIIIMR